MKFLFIGYILLVVFIACETGSSEIVLEEKSVDTSHKQDTSSIVQNNIGKDSSFIVEHDSVVAIQEAFNNKEEKVAVQKEATLPVEIIEINEPERKPPLIEAFLLVADSVLEITYRNKVFPNPLIGCSESETQFRLFIPIFFDGKKTTIDAALLQKSTLEYSYSGGMYFENSVGNPKDGKIHLTPKTKGLYTVDVDIIFPVEALTKIATQEEKRYQLSADFNLKTPSN